MTTLWFCVPVELTLSPEVAAIYPDGIHGTLAGPLRRAGFESVVFRRGGEPVRIEIPAGSGAVAAP